MPRCASAVAIAAASALLAAPAHAEVPPDAAWTEAFIQTPGQPNLHADVLRPKGATGRLPVVLSIGPYFAHAGQQGPTTPTNQGPQLRWRDLIEQGHVFERGYALVQVDLRGYGGSDGCGDLGGPGEQADVARAVRWAAAQPWSTGRVALYGKSYDAWTGIMGLARHPPGLAAVVVMEPIVDGYRGIYENGVHYSAEWYGMGGIYGAYDTTPPTPFDSAQYVRAGATSTDPACYAHNELDGQLDPDPRSAYWRARALGGARGSDVPVLWSHGFMDSTAKPDNFLPVWSTLRGPKRAWLGQFAHDRPNDVANSGHEGWFDELFRFLDRYVKGDASARPDLDPGVEVADGGGRWRAEDRWPPADAVRRSMTLRAGQYMDVAGNYAEHDPAGGAATGRGVWSFTAPLAHAAWISGSALATVRASTDAASAMLIALVYDVDPQGQATLVTRGARTLTSGGAHTVAFDLSPQDWPIAAGHRLGVLVTGDDEDWYLPRHSGAAVDVAGGRLALPFLTYQREAFLPGRVTPAIQARHPIAVGPTTASTVSAQLPPALRPATRVGSSPPRRPRARRPARPGPSRR